MKTVTLDIGTFEVLEELKRKQHESVSLARNLATGEKIILRSQEQEDQTYRLLSMIRHKNLVKVLCVQKDGEKLYVAEEYVQGRLLSDVVEKGLLPKGEVIRICLQLCDALALSEGICLIEKRLVSVVIRHGVNPHLQGKWRATMEIREDFEKRMGCSVYSLFDDAIVNTFGPDFVKVLSN